MEAVKAFNLELSSLYDVKPPISKAKMTALTRGAIKAIKFYKHVVQSVEKFILKCRPEYKVPGLYVIDSIVRQSRHQFGSDKDVFAPRFAKNMQQTFINLFKCPPEDKSKIIRVLNLWQKNQVFPPEVIQPLFDLADPNNPIYKELGTPVQQTNGMNNTTAATQAITKGSPALQKTSTKGTQPGSDSGHGSTSNLNLTDPNVLQQLQQLQRLLTKNVEGSRSESQVHFDKKLLDFDYGDEEDEANPSPRPPPSNANDSVTSLLTNPEVLRQLQTLQQTMATTQAEMDLDKMKKLQEMKQQEEEFDQRLAQTVPNLPFASECEFNPSTNSTMLGAYYMPPGPDTSQQPPGYKTTEYELPQHENSGNFGNTNNNNENINDVEVITLDHEDSRTPTPEERYSSGKRRRSRTRSRDRSGRDRDRDRRSRRSRSKSRSRRHRSRSREKDRKDRDKKDKKEERETEKDRERKKRGLPIIKRENLTVCSTTLWVGHLSKLVHQDDLSNTFGEFGDIVSIDLIPPRGCAFIVMHRRQDAARCLSKLKNHNLHGKSITLAWAPGKGVKGKELKDYWEGDLGVSYIPWSKLKEDIDIEMLEDGGMIDEDTMPPWMKARLEEINKKKKKASAPVIEPPPFLMTEAPKSATIDTSQPPPLPGAGLLQPPLLPLVSPFQFNNRLLSMNVPPAMMPNIPIGVPPPNMPAPMMPNQLLGLSSPFQGPPGLMPPQLPMDNKPPTAPISSTDSNLKSLSETLMSMAQPFGILPQPPSASLPLHDDNMDVEMEDAAEKPDKSMPLSEQLQATMHNQYRDSRGRDDDRRDRDRRDDRSRKRSHSRDRDRERNRRDSRDRDRRDRESSRGRDRRDRGSNRWSASDRDRDRREPDNREDRRDREKNLNERLQEMAGMTVEDRPSRDKRTSESSSSKVHSKREVAPEEDTFRKGNFAVPSMDQPPPSNFSVPAADTKPKLEFIPPPIDQGPPSNFVNPPPIEMAFGPPIDKGFGPPPLNEGPGFIDRPTLDNGSGFGLPLREPPGFGPGPDFRPPMMNGPDFRPPMRDGPDFGPPMRDGLDFGPPMRDGPDFGPPMRHGPDFEPSMRDGPDFGPPMRDGPDFGPPIRRDGMGFDGPPDRFMRGGRRGGDFRDDRGMRGPPGNDYFPQRDSFGPRGPPMRGGHDFGPRGPRGARGNFFGPRGMQRGPRPGPLPFRDGPGFNPRFDGPPEFFRGPRGHAPRMFKDSFPRHRAPRFDDRWRGGRPDFNQGGPPFDRPDFLEGGPPFDRHNFNEGGPPFDRPGFNESGPPFEGPDFQEGDAPFDRPDFKDGDAPFDKPERNRRSRWGDNEPIVEEPNDEPPPPADEGNPNENADVWEGGNTPLRDESTDNLVEEMTAEPEPAEQEAPPGEETQPAEEKAPPAETE